MEGIILDEIERRVKWVIDAILCEKRQYINKHVQNSLNNYFLENYCVLSLKRSLGIMSGRQVKYYILNKYATQMDFPLCGVNLEANPPKKYYLLLLGFLEEHYANGSINEYRQQLLKIVQQTESQITDSKKKRIENPVEDVLEMMNDCDFVEEKDEQIQTQTHTTSNLREINNLEKAEQQSQLQNGGSFTDGKRQELIQIQGNQRENLSNPSLENEQLISNSSPLRHLEIAEGGIQLKNRNDIYDQKLLEIVQPFEISRSFATSNEIIDSEMRDILRADISTKKDWVINQWKKMLALFVLHHSYFPDLEAVYEIWYDIFQTRIVEKRKQKRRRPEHIRQFKYEGLPYVIDNHMKFEERKESEVRERKNQIIEESIFSQMTQVFPKRQQSSNRLESMDINEQNQDFKKHEITEKMENENDAKIPNCEQLIQIKIEMKEIEENNNIISDINCKIESQTDLRNIQIDIGQKKQCKEEQIDQFNQIVQHKSEYIDPANHIGIIINQKKEQQGNKLQKVSIDKKTSKFLAKEKVRNKKIGQYVSKMQEQQAKQQLEAQINHVKLVQVKDKIVSVKNLELTKEIRSCSISHLNKNEDNGTSQQQTRQGFVADNQNKPLSALTQRQQQMQESTPAGQFSQDILRMNPHQLAKMAYTKQKQQQQQQQQSSQKSNKISQHVQKDQNQQKQHSSHQLKEQSSIDPPAKSTQKQEEKQQSPAELLQLNQINQITQPSPHAINETHQLIQQSSNSGQQQQKQQSQQYPFNPHVSFLLQDQNYPQAPNLFVHPSQYYPSQYPSLPQQQPQYPYYPQPLAPQFLQQIPFCAQQQQQPTSSGAIQYVPVQYFTQPPPMQYYPQQPPSMQYYQQQQIQQQQQFLAQRSGMQYFPQSFVQSYPPEAIQHKQYQPFDSQYSAAQMTQQQQNPSQEYHSTQIMLNSSNQAKRDIKSSENATQQNVGLVPVVGSTSTFQHDSNAHIKHANKISDNQDIDNSPSVSPFTTKE